jgi:hypothetical protein
VVIKAMYKSLGQEPLGVQLSLDAVTQDLVWTREARKYLLETERRRHYGQRPMTPNEVMQLQEVPAEWDELAGDAPGEAEKGVRK